MPRCIPINESDWHAPKMHRPTEENIDNGVFIVGSADVQWKMTVYGEQKGHWEYFGGMFTGKSYNRLLWSKDLYYVV